MDHSLNAPEQQPVPGTEEPLTEPQPAPAEKPKRRRFIQPVFRVRLARPEQHAVNKMIMTVLLATTLGGAFAQDKNTAVTKPPQHVSTTSQAQDGWVLFDDGVGRSLGIQDEQLTKLRDMDGRYQKEYSALGNDPVKNPRYTALTAERETEIKGILTPEQYTQWSSRTHKQAGK